MADDDNTPVPVLFRMDTPKNGGACFALFPTIPGSPGYCTAYQHIGQHSSADYQLCISFSRPAKAPEYAALKKELESALYFYRLKVYRRWTPR